MPESKRRKKKGKPARLRSARPIRDDLPRDDLPRDDLPRDDLPRDDLPSVDGIVRSIVRGGRELLDVDGVDLSDPDAAQGWIDAFNARPFEECDAFLSRYDSPER
jgi:hypothetical protein